MILTEESVISSNTNLHAAGSEPSASQKELIILKYHKKQISSLSKNKLNYRRHFL
jgi:hypothetical protein